MIFKTIDIKIKEQKIKGNTYQVKRYVETAYWLGLYIPMIPIYSKQELLKAPGRELNFDVNDDITKVYVPANDEHRVMSGKEEVNYD